MFTRFLHHVRQTRGGLQQIRYAKSRHAQGRRQMDTIQKHTENAADTFRFLRRLRGYASKLQAPENPRASAHHYELHKLYLVVCAGPARTFQSIIYRGPSVAEELLMRLKQEAWAIFYVLSNIVPIQLSVEEEHDFKTAYDCYLCEEPLGIGRVRDHCHLTGNYRGAAHSECNLQLQFKADKETTG